MKDRCKLFDVKWDECCYCDFDEPRCCFEHKWTTKPPEYPGWYWSSWKGLLYNKEKQVHQITVKELPIPQSEHRVWWPIPIQEPPDMDEKENIK